MDRVICPACGAEHDLSEMEPSYRWPDAYLAVPADEREFRTIGGSDDCRMRDADGHNERFFFRALLPIRIRGEERRCSWGVWIEVDERTNGRVRELWRDPAQEREPPFAGKLANTLKGYRETSGLDGALQLTGPTTAPEFTLSSDTNHPLAGEQRDGVYPERVIEWLAEHCND